MRLLWGGVRGEKMPFYGVFHVLIYISTYLKAISPLIYIQRTRLSSIQEYEISHYSLLFIFYKKKSYFGKFLKSTFYYSGNLCFQKLLLQPQHLLNEVTRLDDGKWRLLYSINRGNEIKLKCK